MQRLRQVFRSWRRQKSWTAAALVCLILGIGGSTAVFSVVNNLLLRPLPVEDIDSLAFVLAMREGFDPYGASLLEYEAYKQRARSFQELGIAQQTSFNLTGRGTPVRVPGARVSHEYLEVLGVEARAGRSISEEDDRPGANPAALISHGLWQSRFGGGGTGAVGETLYVDDRPHTIAGVLPPGFDLPARSQVWVPLALDLNGMEASDKSGHAYTIVGRLSPGVSAERAAEELRRLTEGLHQEHPRLTRGWWGHAMPLRRQITGDMDGTLRPALLAVAAACLFVLLIACANVANLSLARTRRRLPEVALRNALGASRRQILKQFLSESLLLSVVGGLMGLATAYLLTGWLFQMSPIQSRAATQAFQTVSFDWRVLAVGLALTLATGLAAGVLPARRVLRTADITSILASSGKAGSSAGRDRVLSLLVVAQMAFAMLLLTGAGLMVRSFQALSGAELGFRPENRLSMELSLPEQRYPDFQSRLRFAERLLTEVESLPGVLSADISNNIPLDDGTWDAGYEVEGAPEPDPSSVPITAHRLVSPGYLRTIGAQLVEGRLLEESDREDSRPVVVITEEFARRSWPEAESALGKRVRIPNLEDDNPWHTVVGVVRDVKEDRPNYRIDRPVWYIPFSQRENESDIDLVVHSRLDPSTLADTLRRAVWSIDPDQPVSHVVTFEENVASFLGPERFSALLMGLFGAAGLLLAAIGLYGVLSYGVGQRTREIGVRLAMGARPGDIVRHFLGEGLASALLGLFLGLGAALIAGRYLSGVLYGVSPLDPLSLLMSAAFVAASALLAVWLPSRRAARLDPALAVRAEGT